MIPTQNTPEWREWRKSKIGASDAAAILGISPWTTPLELYEEKLGLRPQKDLTAAMARGMKLEERARVEYERISGELVFPQVVVHPHFYWCIASLDGISLNKKHIVEIKCPNKFTHELASKGQVPPHYYAQLQHQLFVTGLNTVDYFSFDGENGFLVVVDRDDLFIENMIKEEMKFLECLLTNTPPDNKEEVYTDLSSNSDFKTLEYWYIYISEKIKYFEEKKEAYRKMIIEISGGKNSFGNKIRVTKKTSKGRIDYDKIECLKEVELEIYRKPSSTSFLITYNQEK